MSEELTGTTTGDGESPPLTVAMLEAAIVALGPPPPWEPNSPPMISLADEWFTQQGERLRARVLEALLWGKPPMPSVPLAEAVREVERAQERTRLPRWLTPDGQLTLSGCMRAAIEDPDSILLADARRIAGGER